MPPRSSSSAARSYTPGASLGSSASAAPFPRPRVTGGRVSLSGGVCASPEGGGSLLVPGAAGAPPEPAPTPPGPDPPSPEDPPASTSASAASTSSADAGRSSGDFSRSFRQSESSAGGHSGESLAGG